MSHRLPPQFSLFRSQIHNRRFDDGSLRILESVLPSKDVKSLLEVRSSLREFMKSEFLSVIHEVAEKTIEQKLSVLEFFVRAFALAGDVESCLALRYEALVLRELKSASYQWLQVSYREWLTFAEHSLDTGFYSLAGKACENAVLCLQKKDIADPKTDEFFESVQVIEQIKRLKDVAVASAASGSVQAQAAEYLKRKTTERSNKKDSSYNKETQCLASALFRNGIKKWNMRKLHEHQKLQQITNESQSTQFRGSC